jgi:hypothetical protein
MGRFWKFNAFVGTVGIVLLVAAFFAGRHTYSLTFNPSAPGDSPASLSWIGTTSQSLYMCLVGAGCLVWQMVMTVIGLLVGFFRAPSAR